MKEGFTLPIFDDLEYSKLVIAESQMEAFLDNLKDFVFSCQKLVYSTLRMLSKATLVHGPKFQYRIRDNLTSLSYTVQDRNTAVLKYSLVLTL